MRLFAKIPRPAGTAGYSLVHEPELQPALVIFVEREAKATGGGEEFSPSTTTPCYVPTIFGK